MKFKKGDLVEVTGLTVDYGDNGKRFVLFEDFFGKVYNPITETVSEGHRWKLPKGFRSSVISDKFLKKINPDTDGNVQLYF